MVQQSKTMEFRELLAFSRVAQIGGITAAADSLALSKSTVSLQISRLEQRLDVRLFERNSRRVALTREGERLLPRVNSLLQEMQLLIEETESAVDVPGGVVRIAVTPALGRVVLRHLVPRLQITHPNLRLVVNSTYDLDDLHDPNFDFAIRVGRIFDDKLVAKPVGSFRRILVASPEFLAGKVLNTPDDLQNVPCLIFSGRSVQTNWVLQSKSHPDVTQTVPINSHVAVRSFSSLLDLARDGLGVMSVITFLVQDDIDSSRLVRCLPDWQSPPVEVMLAYRFGASKVARVAAALKETRIVVQELLSQP